MTTKKRWRALVYTKSYSSKVSMTYLTVWNEGAPLLLKSPSPPLRKKVNMISKVSKVGEMILSSPSCYQNHLLGLIALLSKLNETYSAVMNTQCFLLYCRKHIGMCAINCEFLMNSIKMLNARVDEKRTKEKKHKNNQLEPAK